MSMKMKRRCYQIKREMIKIGLSKLEKERRKEERRLKRWNETHEIIDGVDHKKCNKCELYLPANNDYFYNNPVNQTDGLYPYCITCAIIKSTIWENENVEKKRKAQRKYNLSTTMRIYQKENRKRRYKEGYYKEYFLKNPNKQAEYNRNHKNHDITKNEWEECKKYFNNSCAYCEMTEKEHREHHNQQLHKEHVDHNGDNNLSNCVPACRSCNSEKNDKEFEEWYNKTNPKFTVKRFYKIMEWLGKDYLIFLNFR
jgi:hypothetical protein